MNHEDIEKVRIKCRKLAKNPGLDPKLVVGVLEETLEILSGIVSRQRRQASNIQKMAAHTGMNKKYL